MKRLTSILLTVYVVIFFTACTANPFTGKKTLALVNNESLFASSFVQYNTFLKESNVVTGTPEANMVKRVGERIRLATEKWAEAEGQKEYLDKYKWEYNLVDSSEVNAWAMPGGKIVFYSGMLPVTENEAGLAVVMGHEVAHAILNHGQQRVSANILQQIGAVGLNILTSDQSPEIQALAMTIYGAGSALFGTLPYSRAHETEADRVGLVLMTIAGYDPETAAEFWQRMSSLKGSSMPQVLSTHPSDGKRVEEMKNYLDEARRIAGRVGIIKDE